MPSKAMEFERHALILPPVNKFFSTKKNAAVTRAAARRARGRRRDAVEQRGAGVERAQEGGAVGGVGADGRC